MFRFKIGDRALFAPEGRGIVFGVLTRYNKKSVAVISESGQRWTVAPQPLKLRRRGGRRRTARRKRSAYEKEMMLPNNTFERTVKHRGPFLARPEYGARQERQSASRPAAQLGR